ncbi:hypothetical protein HPB52_013699 [Rhipicephalus sanguineus]|uniref:Uncharacterized protein n=1 Tax=Rhipicephalus sanguineus TaxID=34632 RepID=A0A9D4Q9C0_RHISA|nr:hypothetical protein HPB52_013699 [Rhipicephalus sanguineus]
MKMEGGPFLNACTPSTSTEALDGNQADSGTCSPTTNAEVTESTEVGNGNVSSAFNATDLETADVDGAILFTGSNPKKLNEVGNSVRMQLEGLRRGLQFLLDMDKCISSIVTDRHSSIRAYLKREHPEIAQKE